MTPISVVLSNSEHDEYELGIFNQGVVLELVLGMTIVVDIASGQPIATESPEGWRWGRHIGPYELIFFHGVEPRIDTGSPEHFLAELEGHSIRNEEGLSTRAKNALLRGGLVTLEQVTERTEREFIDFWPNFGKSCAEEVRYALHAIGLDYREET